MNLLWALALFCLIVTIEGRRKSEKVPESMLDSNRSFMIDDERVFVPKKLPTRLTADKKLAFVRRRGVETQTRGRRKQCQHHSLLVNDKPWRTYRNSLLKPPSPLISADPHLCPKTFDAITEGHNRRTYVFAGNLVYQIWRHDGLQQRAAYKIQDLFIGLAGGPNRVTAALTNLRSGVTILISHRRVFRYRWNKKDRRFYLTRNSPHNLNETINFAPTFAFQWTNGNLILSDGVAFSIYDPYCNVATFHAKLHDYFPNWPRNAIGLAHNGGTTFLLFTSHNKLQVYDVKRYKILQEYPIKVNDFAACLTSR